MVTDYLNWMSRYEAGSAHDIIHCFNYPGLHQFFHFLNYSFYSIWGTAAIPWYLLFAFLHGFNSYLVLRLIQRSMALFKCENIHPFVPYVISFAFLIFPYNVEAVIWKACLHYLLSFLLLSSTILITLKYLKNNNNSILKWMHLLYLLNLFTIEISFIYPLISLVYILLFYLIHSEKKNLSIHIKRIFIPQILILIFYLLLSKWTLGNYIGHYGVEKHFVFSLDLLGGNSLKYFFKNLLFVHFWPFNYKSAFYGFLARREVIYTALLITFFIIAFFLKKWNNLTNIDKLAFTKSLLFFLGIAPVITLFFSWILLFENDRYGYFSSLFFISGLFLFLNSIKYMWLKNILMMSYIAFALLFFAKMIQNSYIASIINNKLLENYTHINEDEEVFILGIPDNYQGLLLFRDYANEASFFKMGLHFNQKIKNKAKIFDVAQFNAATAQDGIKIQFLENGKIRVSFNQYGNWFWKNGIGLSSYETDEYVVERGDWFYDLDIKQKRKNQVFIYSNGLDWESTDWPESAFFIE